MANLTPNASWDNVPQLETTTPALGGAGGPMNAQAQALANKFAYLEGENGSSKIGYKDAGNVVSDLQTKLREHDAALENIGGNLNFETLVSATTPVAANDLLIIRQGVDNKKIAASVFKTEFASEANLAADRAEAARDAAVIGANIYPDEPTGRAAVADGEYFKVQGSADVAVYEYRRVNSTTSSLVATYPSLSAVKTSIDDALPIGRNLFDKTRSSVGKYIDTVGGLSTDAAYSATDFIYVSPSSTYNISNGSAAHLAYYTAAKVFVSYVTSVTAFTTPANANYIRFSQTTNAFNNLVLVKGGTVPSVYTSFASEDSASAKRTILSTVQDIVSNYLPQDKNLFDQSRAQLDKGIDSLGNIFTLAGYYTTPFIQVTPSVQFVSNKGGQGQYFDENLKFVSAFTVASNTPFTPPAKAYYFRQQVSGLAQRTSHIVVKGSSIPSFSEFSPPSWKSNIPKVRDVVTSYLPKTLNLFDKLRASDNTAVSNVNGVTYTASGYFTTDFIPISESASWYSTISNLTGAYYDQDKKFLSGFTALNSQPATAPAGAYFVRFQRYGLSDKAALVVTNGEVPSGYIPFLGAGTSSLPWQGKRLLVAGDSISYTGYWIPTFVAGTGMVLDVNHAVAGRAVRDMGKKSDGTTFVSSDLTSIDFVSVFGGTNDYGGSRPLGTIADAVAGNSAATFYADVFNLLTLFYTLKPSVRVMFSTPLIRGAFESQPVHPAANSAGATLPQYVQAIKEVCAMFGTPVCDLYAESGINLLNLSTFTADNLHPNTLGGELHARVMVAKANSI